MKMKLLYGALAALLVLSLAACQAPVAPESRALPDTQIRDLRVQHDAAVDGNATVGGNLNVTGTASITGGYTSGTSTIYEGATANDYETTLAVTDPTADRTATLPNASGYVMLGGGTGKYIFGVNTVTTTLTLQHGLTTPQTAFCTLIQDSEANGATCTTTIDGGTGAVVLKLWKADGATAGSVGKQIAWMVGGLP